jgi:hypothetical protein
MIPYIVGLMVKIVLSQNNILNRYVCKIWYTNWSAVLVNEYKFYVSIQKVRTMQNLGNVFICGSPFVMSRTDAQNGIYSIFKDFAKSYIVVQIT